MTSPAWRYRERIQQAEAAKAAKARLEAADKKAVREMARGSANHKLLLTAVEVECKRISALPKGQARTDLKRELLKTYLPVVKKYIEGKEVFENTVLTQVMIWCFDVGDIAEALKLAAVAIEQNQPLPERFDRDVKTFVADAVLEWARSQFAAGNTAEPYFSAMLADVLKWAVHDEIKLKYVKLAAEIAQQAGELDKALEYCNQAESIDPVKAQVKTRKAQIEKAIALRDEKARAAAAKQ